MAGRTHWGWMLAAMVTAAPAAGQPVAGAEEVRIHVVRPGDTLEGITSQYLGSDTFWRDVWRLNPEIADPHKLTPGQRVKVPAANAALASVARVARRVDKQPHTQTWTPAHEGDRLKQRDGVRTAANSSAELQFRDGARLVLNQESVVFLREPQAAATMPSRSSLEIVEGQADVRQRAAAAGHRRDLEVVVGDAVARPRAGAEGSDARLRRTPVGTSHFMIYKGAAEVEAAGAKVPVAAGQGVAVPAGGKPGAPETLLSSAAGLRPAGTTWQAGGPAFTWNPVKGATSYGVEVCRDPACDVIARAQSGLPVPRWEPSSLPVGDVYWRVVAVSGSGLDGQRGPVARLRVLGAIRGAVRDLTGGGEAGRSGVTVRLLRDGGDGEPDGKDDKAVGTARTDAGGAYAFERLGDGRYWVAASSREVGAGPRNPGSEGAALWAEQVAGPAGALCADGQGGTLRRETAGPCFGGRRGATSDDPASLGASEHVAAVVLGDESEAAAVDFGFAFDAVTTTADDGQGSLRAALTAAGALSGIQTVRFAPAIAPDARSGEASWWTIGAGTPLPALSDGTTLDGRALSLTDATVRDTNPGRLGTPGPVGVGAIPLVTPERPELLLRGAPLELSAGAGLRSLAVTSPLLISGCTLDGVAIGVLPDGSRPEGTPGGLTVKSGGDLKLLRSLVGPAAGAGILVEPGARLEADHVEFQGAAVKLSGDRSILRHALLREAAGQAAVVVGAEGPATANAVEDSTVLGSAQGVFLGPGARQSVVLRNVFDGSASGAVVLAAPAAGLVPVANRVSQNRYLGRGGLIDLGATPVAAPPCSRDPQRSNEGLQPPAIASAAIGMGGAALVAGQVCPGQSVEVYRITKGDTNRMDLVGSDATGECGQFAVRSRDLAAGDKLVALAIDAAGNTSAPGPEVAVTASREPEATIQVAGGQILVRLLPQLAPNHVDNFAAVARERGYDGTIFHRVVPGELVQGGDPFTRDPKETARYGTGGLGDLAAEFSDLCVRRGLLVAARCPTDCDSAGTQFFLTARDQPAMTGHFTVFGDVLSGMDVVDALASSQAEGERPRDRLEMQVSVTQPEGKGKRKGKGR